VEENDNISIKQEEEWKKGKEGRTKYLKK